MQTAYRDFQIHPSILSADFGKLSEEAATVDMPEVEFLHVDVMDGHFVPNITVGPQVVATLKAHTRFKLDVHLMIENAPQYIPEFAEAGADYLTIHQEAVVHLDRAIHQIKDNGARAGVSLNPATPPDTLKWVLKEIDLILVMSVNPGFGGQEFIPSSIEKIRQLHKWRLEGGHSYRIAVDGGIDPTTAGKVYLAGADFLVSGSAVFKQADRKKAIRNMIDAVEQAKRENESEWV
ncbi:MAG: ribulose-phosphate 3-epimerase [Calditrichia bacterium]